MMPMTSEAQSRLEEIGRLIATARMRRHLSVRALAARIGADRRTLADLEKGRPGVSIGVFVSALSALDLAPGLEEALRPENDLAALSLNIRRLRSRRSPLRSIPDEKVSF